MQSVFEQQVHPKHHQKLKFQLYSNESTTARFKKQTLTQHKGCVNTVAWNSRGDLLISGSDDCHINIWKPFERKLVADIFTQHTSNIFCAKFMHNTNDTQTDSEIRHLDISDGKKPVIRCFTEHNGMVKKLEIEPGSSSCFLSCSQDGTARFYDLRQKSNSSDSQILVDLRTGRSRLHRQNHTVDINSISLNPLNPNYFIVGGGDPYVRLYDRRTNKCVTRFSPKVIMDESDGDAHITGVRFNQYGTEILASYSENDIYLFSVDNVYKTFHENVKKFVDSMEVISQDFTRDSSDDEQENIEFTPQSNPIIDPYEKINEGNVDSNVINVFAGHRNVRTVKEVNFYGPHDEYVISGSDDGNIFFWNKDTTKLVNVVVGDKHIVNCLAPHPWHIPVIATSGIENDVKVWYPNDPEKRDSRLVDGKVVKKENEGQEFDPFVISRRDLVTLLEMLSSRQPGTRAGIGAQNLMNQLFGDDDEEDEEDEENDDIEQDQDDSHHSE